eukprot:8489690-Pyramimonas_sp.AAC.1
MLVSLRQSDLIVVPHQHRRRSSFPHPQTPDDPILQPVLRPGAGFQMSTLVPTGVLFSLGCVPAAAPRRERSRVAGVVPNGRQRLEFRLDR